LTFEYDTLSFFPETTSSPESDPVITTKKAASKGTVSLSYLSQYKHAFDLNECI